MNAELESFRKEIDEIDLELIKLIEKRLKICKDVGKCKLKNDISVENKQREKEVIQKLISKTSLDKRFVSKLFELLLDESKRLQRNLK